MAISRESLGIAMGKRVRAATRAAATYSLLMLVPALALAAAETRAQPCDVVEPDSLQISWTAPCQDGSWMLDPRGAGCRLWDWHPAPEDTATWSGACLSGRKEGHGVVQWYEHGRPIDRFEGVFRRGKREGFGRYDWPAGQRYQGTYETDLPNGQGTVTIDGVSFAGAWRRGCLAHGDKLIAIGVPLSTCGRGKRPPYAGALGFAAKRLQAQAEFVQSLSGCNDLPELLKRQSDFWAAAWGAYATELPKVLQQRDSTGMSQRAAE